MDNHSSVVSFIWSIAESLRGAYKQHEYGDVILPMVVLRRLDAVMEEHRDAMQAAVKGAGAKGVDLERYVTRKTGLPFYNTSKFRFSKLTDDSSDLAANLKNYINGFSPNAREILEKFRYHQQIDRLQEKKRLFSVLSKFKDAKLGPQDMDNHNMGYVYEELLRKFSEISNETAGEHFTPRDIVRLMVDLLLATDNDVISRPGAVTTIYDPACGTGGMLSVAKSRILELNPAAKVVAYGQEDNDFTYATANADMLIQGEDTKNLACGNTLTDDAHPDKKFDYMLSNPPFGVDWSVYEKVKDLLDEAETGSGANRFHAGLPRKSDGAFLFLQHMISKMQSPEKGGSRIAIVFNGSPLFTGDAGSGESEIRRWLMESDMVEAIVGLPDQLFYNTGINTYIWIVTNRKDSERKGKVQLIDARDEYQKARKSLGEKRKELTDANRANIVRLYDEFEEGKQCKILDSTEFGYRVITVERPLQLNYSASPERVEQVRSVTPFQNLTKVNKKLKPEHAEKAIAEGEAIQERIIEGLLKIGPKVTTDGKQFRDQVKAVLDEAGGKWTPANVGAIVRALAEHDPSAPVITKRNGDPEPDSSLRDRERVPLGEPIEDYMAREVQPWVPDAWVDEAKTDAKDGDVGIVGYEINFNRHFYEYIPPRPLAEIDAALDQLETEISGLLKQVAA